MATNALEICNSALTLVGARRIVSLSDPSLEARECNANYDIARKATLRDFPWNWATKRVVLDTADSTAPAFEYQYRFAIPDDFIRNHTVYDTSACILEAGRWRLESDFYLTDEATLWVRYVYNVTDTTLFDPIFDEAVAAKLAHKISFKLNASESTRAEVAKIYMDCLRRAKFTSSTEEPSEKLDADEWVRSRYGRASDFIRDPGTN